MNRSQYVLLPLAVLFCCVNFSNAQEAGVLEKTSWNDRNGYPLEPALIVNYETLQINVKMKNNNLYANGTLTSKLNPSERSALQAVLGGDSDSIVQRLKTQRLKSVVVPMNVVLMQQANGQLVRVPVVMLAPADQLLATRAAQQIAVRRQAEAQSQALLVQAKRSIAKRRGASVARGLMNGTTGGGNYEQEGEFEGQFGDQSGPDSPGGSEGGENED